MFIFQFDCLPIFRKVQKYNATKQLTKHSQFSITIAIQGKESLRYSVITPLYNDKYNYVSSAFDINTRCATHTLNFYIPLFPTDELPLDDSNHLSILLTTLMSVYVHVHVQRPAVLLYTNLRQCVMNEVTLIFVKLAIRDSQFLLQHYCQICRIRQLEAKTNHTFYIYKECHTQHIHVCVGISDLCQFSRSQTAMGVKCPNRYIANGAFCLGCYCLSLVSPFSRSLQSLWTS